MNTQSSIHRRDFLVRAGAGLAAASAGSKGTALAQEKASPVAGALPGLTIKQQPVARMLSRGVFVTLRRLHMRQAMTDANCLATYNDQGYRGEADLMPRAPFQRASVFRGSREHGNYQHHQQITKFRGRYYLAWSNGLLDEEAPGQQILIAHSTDGLHWSEPQPALPREKDGLVHNCAGLHGGEKELLLYVWNEVAASDAKAPGMRRIEAASKRVDLYASSDGERWTPRTPRMMEPGKDHCPMFEAPRPTRDGIWLCGGSCNGPVVFRWKSKDHLSQPPEIIRVPDAPDAIFPYGETSWYQTRDGLLVMFWRDEGQSMRLYVNTSADGGRSWTQPILSDIPNSMQRVSAGNLPDGRAYLISDANPKLLDRRQLTIALSEDGRTFDRILMLVDDPVKQRIPGLLKAHGWQYPHTLVDGSKLFIAYSVNKEDIECGIVDLAKL